MRGARPRPRSDTGASDGAAGAGGETPRPGRETRHRGAHGPTSAVAEVADMVPRCSVVAGSPGALTFWYVRTSRWLTVANRDPITTSQPSTATSRRLRRSREHPGSWAIAAFSCSEGVYPVYHACSYLLVSHAVLHSETGPRRDGRVLLSGGSRQERYPAHDRTCGHRTPVRGGRTFNISQSQAGSYLRLVTASEPQALTERNRRATS